MQKTLDPSAAKTSAPTENPTETPAETPTTANTAARKTDDLPPELDQLAAELFDSPQPGIVRIYEIILRSLRCSSAANVERIFLSMVSVRRFLLNLTTGDLFAIEQLLPRIYPTVVSAIAELGNEDPAKLPKNTLEILRVIHCRQRHITAQYDEHLSRLKKDQERVARLEDDLKKATLAAEQVRFENESGAAYYNRLNRHIHEVLESVSPEVHAAVCERLGENYEAATAKPLPGSDLCADLEIRSITEWSTHTRHFLARAKIYYLYQLLEQTPDQLKAHYNIGDGTVKQITDYLSAHGLSLAATPK